MSWTAGLLYESGTSKGDQGVSVDHLCNLLSAAFMRET